LACPVLPASDQATSLRGFYGRWCQEFQLQDVPWRRGVHMRENRLGRTSHEHIPAFLIPTAGASEHTGEVWGCQLGWSGDHRSLAEELPDGRRQLQFGELLAPGQVSLESGQHYTSPTLYSSYSNTGYNGLSWAFHRHCRQQILNSPTWLAERPVHYNCWEAIYFDHQWDTLTSIVERAVAAGAELFVLDDGWFLNRHDDTAGLGDWHPDPNKYPAGLTPLIEYVQQQGLRFGLWVEPEMVNKDSELYRSHPDWILDIADYDQVAGRHQYVLDLTRPEVVEYLFESLQRLLADHAIDYLKWDMNRSANLAADQHGRAVGGRQVRALYQLLARLREAFPHVVIESCSSGGGRMDLGILRHTDRFWLSDSNDAHERWHMQRNASLLLPPEVIGSHVGPAVCHTSGRRLSMNFRAPVAASRHMGFELDPREMSEREADTLRLWSAWYKSHRQLLHQGRHFRLECAEPGILAEMFVEESTGQTIVFAAQLTTQQHAASQPLRLAGLQPDGNYRLQLVHNRRAAPAANRDDASPLLREGGVDVPGAVLMQQGIILPNSLPDTVWVIEGLRLPAGA
ncbi:MAG: alpha-galactosidase, partial [Pseudomonadota bacterium]